MKVKLICSKKTYEEIKDELDACGIIIDDNASLILEEVKTNNIRVKNNNEYFFIDYANIYSIQSFDHEIVVEANDSLTTRTPLREIEQELNDDFMRISQSIIINKKKIIKIKRLYSYKYEITLNNHNVYTSTKSYYKLITDELEGRK